MITIKPFMSAWDVDVKRLMKCCVHEVLPDNKIMPFCAYNIKYRDQYYKKYFNTSNKNPSTSKKENTEYIVLLDEDDI